MPEMLPTFAIVAALLLWLGFTAWLVLRKR